MGELAACEPAARLHLQRYLEIHRRSDDWEFEEERVPLRKPPIMITPGSAERQSWPGVCVCLAVDGLKVTRRSGAQFTPSYAQARGRETTTLADIEEVLPVCCLQMRIEQREGNVCDVFLTLTQLSLELARQKLVAELITPDGQIALAVSVEDGHAEFQGLPPGEFALVIVGEDREVLRYVLEITVS